MALLVAAVSILLGMLRVGSVVNFISHTVLAAFCTAAGITIGTSQIKYVLGVKLPRDAYWWQTIKSLVAPGRAGGGSPTQSSTGPNGTDEATKSAGSRGAASTPAHRLKFTMRQVFGVIPRAFSLSSSRPPPLLLSVPVAPAPEVSAFSAVVSGSRVGRPSVRLSCQSSSP